MKLRTSSAVLAVSVTALLAIPAGASADAAPLPALSGATCYIPLTYGQAILTRTTGRVRGGYWTAIVLSTTGDAFRPTWNQGLDLGARGATIRRVAGFRGVVYATRSFGFRSTTGNVIAAVGVVDVNSGRYGSTAC